MYRVTYMSNKFYACEIESVAESADSIQALAEEGNPTIIIDELEELERTGIVESVNDIEIVDAD